jgi:hypothetical protein
MSAVRLKRSPVDFCSRSLAATSSVASTSSQIVASGIVEREWLRRVPMILRIPAMGMRWSPGSVGAAGATGAASIAATASSTSRRTTSEPGPDPRSCVASIPCSSA